LQQLTKVSLIMYRLLTITLVLFLPLLTHAQAAEIDFAKEDWAGLMSNAKASGKLIFLDAYTTWCGPCKRMDKKVFNDPKVASFFNSNFVNAKFDMEKGEGEVIARTFGIAAFPTLIFINGDGKMIHRGVGFHDVDELINLAKTAEAGSGTLSQLFEEFESGKNTDPEFLYELTQKSFELQNNSHIPVAEAYLKANPSFAAGDRMDFIFSMATSARSSLFDNILAERPAFKERFGAQSVEGKIQDLIYQEADPEMDPKDLYKLDALFAKAIDYMKANKKAPAGELNDLSWTFFQVVENPTLLKSAVKWSKKATKLDRKSHHFDTLSSLYEKVGNIKKALQAAQAGILLAKADGGDDIPMKELIERLTSTPKS